MSPRPEHAQSLAADARWQMAVTMVQQLCHDCRESATPPISTTPTRILCNSWDKSFRFRMKLDVVTSKMIYGHGIRSMDGGRGGHHSDLSSYPLALGPVHSTYLHIFYIHKPLDRSTRLVRLLTLALCDLTDSRKTLLGRRALQKQQTSGAGGSCHLSNRPMTCNVLVIALASSSPFSHTS
jgi:hypothetical protein